MVDLEANQITSIEELIVPQVVEQETIISLLMEKGYSSRGNFWRC